MAQRPGRTSGTIFKRIRSGKPRWVAQVELPRDAQGKRRRRTLYGDTRGEVQANLDKLRAQLRIGVEVDAGREAFKTFAETWLRDVRGEQLRASTREVYGDLLRLHVLPELGSRPLDRIRPSDLLTWQGELQRRGVGNRTRRAAFALVKTILGTAVKHNALYYNPAERVEPPKAATARRSALEPGHVRALLDAARERGAEAIVALGVVHGLRIGEALGLQWRHVDFAAGTVRVEQQLAEGRRSGKRVVEPPKTTASMRDVPLSRLALEALRRHKARLPAIPHGTALVFEAPNGGPIRRSNWHRRVWVPIRKAAGLDSLRYHDLRHSAASAMLGAGIDVATTAAILGHSSPAVTLRVYSHSIPSRQREAAAMLDTLYSVAADV